MLNCLNARYQPDSKNSRVLCAYFPQSKTFLYITTEQNQEINNYITTMLSSDQFMFCQSYQYVLNTKRILFRIMHCIQFSCFFRFFFSLGESFSLTFTIFIFLKKNKPVSYFVNTSSNFKKSAIQICLISPLCLN